MLCLNFLTEENHSIFFYGVKFRCLFFTVLLVVVSCHFDVESGNSAVDRTLYLACPFDLSNCNVDGGFSFVGILGKTYCCISLAIRISATGPKILLRTQGLKELIFYFLVWFIAHVSLAYARPPE